MIEIDWTDDFDSEYFLIKYDECDIKWSQHIV